MYFSYRRSVREHVLRQVPVAGPKCRLPEFADEMGGRFPYLSYTLMWLWVSIRRPFPRHDLPTRSFAPRTRATDQQVTTHSSVNHSSYLLLLRIFSYIIWIALLENMCFFCFFGSLSKSKVNSPSSKRRSQMSQCYVHLQLPHLLRESIGEYRRLG